MIYNESNYTMNLNYRDMILWFCYIAVMNKALTFSGRKGLLNVGNEGSTRD